jgi:ABC-type lipoprotein release transport system permease subunit
VTTAVFQIVGIVLAAGILGIAVLGLGFAIAQSLRRGAVIPLASRYAISRFINIVPPLGIAIGVAALIIVISVMNGFISEQRKLIRGTLSDLTIQPFPISQGKEGHRSMPGRYQDYKKILDTIPDVAGSAPRFMWAAMAFPPEVLDIYNLARKGSEFIVEIRGIDPAAEATVGGFEQWIGPLRPDDLGVTARERGVYQTVADPKNPFPKYKVEGRLEKDSVIVGVSLATKLRLHRGHFLEFGTFSPVSTLDELKQANKKFHVAGMFHTQEQEFDSRTVLVSIPAIQNFLGETGENATDFTEIAIRLKDYNDAAGARQRIGEKLEAAGLIVGRPRDNSTIPYTAELVTWEDQKAGLLAAVDNERGILGFVLFILIIVAAFIQFATLSMMVTEKTKDIGILATLGASASEILAVFVDVGVAMTLIGEMVGVALALAVTSRLNEIDGLIETISGRRIFNPDVYYLKSIPSEVDPMQVVWILGLTLAAGIVASLIPAVRASRLHPADALRYE